MEKYMRKANFYCKWCDCNHGLKNEQGDVYDHCPRCGRKKPEASEQESPLDDWNRHEMEGNPLELVGPYYTRHMIL